MDVLDLQNEMNEAPDDQLTYDVMMNIGSPEDGDVIVRVGEVEWQHNEKRIVIQQEEYV